MTAKREYPAGVPCWVETLQPDPHAALSFYGELMRWEATGPGSMPDGGEYFIARRDGDDVAGVATLPRDGTATTAWTTYVSVDDLEAACERVRAAGGRVLVPPLGALPAGRFAVVRSPAGAIFGLWKAEQRAGAQRVNASGAWAMSTLHARDLDAAAAFYAAVFGWTAEPFDMGGPPTLVLRRAGYVGGQPEQPVPRDVVAVAMHDDAAEHDFWAVDFWIDDIEAAVACVAARSGRVIVPPFDVGPFRQAVVSDPAGAVFTLNQLVAERLAIA